MKSQRKIAKGLLLITASVFLAVALYTFDQRDWGSFWRVKNLCGPVGSVLGGILRLSFGPVFAWFWPFFVLYLALQALGGKGLWDERRRLACTFALYWVVVASAAAWRGHEAGGLFGFKTSVFLELIAGRIGSVLVLAGMFLVACAILFWGSLKALLDGLGAISLAGVAKILPKSGKTKPQIAVKGRRRQKETAGMPADAAEEPLKIALSEPTRPKVSGPRSPEAAVSSLGMKNLAGNAPLPDQLLLEDTSGREISYSREDLIARSEVIEQKLGDYGLQGKIREVRPGPVVTTFEFVPAPGVKVSQIASRVDDISLALAARSIRIEAPIPGKGAVGIEVPNPEPDIVSFKVMMMHYPVDGRGLQIALGKTVTGEPFFADLAEMPHLLIAGSTGSGKSVCINSIICSLLFHHTPASCRFILVDPKRLELITYNDIPHLLHPVITEAKVSLRVFQWLTSEMDRRYRLLASVGVKNITSYNRKVAKEKLVSPESGEPLERLAYYITIIDELADIMVIMGNEIYPPITRLAQMARAVGIHLVFATQRPSVDIVTGIIKANFPCRIAFQVASKIDSRTILDINGAEKLLGNGDMLYLPKDRPNPIRLQGSFISEAEAERVADYWRRFSPTGEPLDLDEESAACADEQAEIDDELFNKARELVIIHQQGSISLLQRRLRVGYARAARLIDMLEQAGVVGPFEGSKARRVFVSREEYERK